MGCRHSRSFFAPVIQFLWQSDNRNHCLFCFPFDSGPSLAPTCGVALADRPKSCVFKSKRRGGINMHRLILLWPLFVFGSASNQVRENSRSELVDGYGQGFGAECGNYTVSSSVEATPI